MLCGYGLKLGIAGIFERIGAEAAVVCDACAESQTWDKGRSRVVRRGVL